MIALALLKHAHLRRRSELGMFRSHGLKLHGISIRSATLAAQRWNSSRLHSKRWSSCRKAPAARFGQRTLYSRLGVVRTTVAGRAN